MNNKIITSEFDKIILVDQDGVLADFDSYFLDKWNELYPEKVSDDIKDRKTFKISDFKKENIELIKNIHHSKEFYLNLPVVEGSLEALLEMENKGYDVFICTSPLTKSKFCLQEKTDWIENNFLELYKKAKHPNPEKEARKWRKKVILTKDKTLVGGLYLIDDNPVIKGAIKNPIWEHVIFDRPYNREISDYAINKKLKEALRIENENIMIEKINNYIKKYQRGESGMNGDNVLAISREYNIAIDLILTMAHKESHFGTNGRAVATNNPFNVGNTDCGDGKKATNDGCSTFLKTTEDGMRLWGNYVSKCYFNGARATLDGMFAIDFKVQFAVDGLCGAGTIGKAYMSGCNNKSICEAIKGGYRELRVLVNHAGIENNSFLE